MPFCLVILDLNLGDTSYPEPLMENPWQGSFVLARRIRQAKPALPVVIFSACSNPANGHAARLAGAEYLSKHDAPGNLALLCRRLESAA
jgi:DNA-binding NarL/FixJ family response regulator